MQPILISPAHPPLPCFPSPTQSPSGINARRLSSLNHLRASTSIPRLFPSPLCAHPPSLLLVIALCVMWPDNHTFPLPSLRSDVDKSGCVGVSSLPPRWGSLHVLPSPIAQACVPIRSVAPPLSAARRGVRPSAARRGVRRPLVARHTLAHVHRHRLSHAW
jgi:hypothetical protein